FHRFSNRNFHENVLYQYHHLFYFHVLFDCIIQLLASRVISFSAFERLHNSCIDRSFLYVNNVRHFRVFRSLLPCKVYRTILHYVKCAVCDALSAIRRMSDQSDKNIKTFLFFQRKKKQKNLTSATSAKWNLLSCQRLKIRKGQVVFFEKTTQKISTFKPLQTFILSDFS